VQIEILGPDGEIWHTGTSSAAPGLHRYSWNFRGVAPPPPPKTEEQIQDSIRAVARVQEIVDSLVAEGSDRAQLERMRDMLLSGNRQGLMGAFGGGGAGAAEPGEFVERPGESWASGGRGGGGGFTPEMRVLFQAARAITGGGGFGGGGRGGAGQAPMADAGRYTVVLRVADQEFRQTLTVVKGPDAGEGGSFFQDLR